MPKRVQYICDSCGREKKETNHWFVLEENSTKFILSSFEDGLEGEGEGDLMFLCGANCIHKKLERYMDQINKFGTVKEW